MQNFDSRRRFLCEINEYMYEYMFNTPLENHKNILTERDFVQKETNSRYRIDVQAL